MLFRSYVYPAAAVSAGDINARMLYTVGDQFNVFYFSFEVEPYVIQGSGGLVAQLQS